MAIAIKDLYQQFDFEKRQTYMEILSLSLILALITIYDLAVNGEC